MESGKRNCKIIQMGNGKYRQIVQMGIWWYWKIDQKINTTESN